MCLHRLKMGKKPLPHMARARNVLRRCRDDDETFFRFVFVYRQSRKRNGIETTIPEVVFVCFAMLSVSLCGTFYRFAVHGGETEKCFVVIVAMSRHILSTRHVRQRFPKM